MRSRSRSRRPHRTRRRVPRRITHRRRGGAINANKLREMLDMVPDFHFRPNESKFNEKGFDKAKKWFDHTFHQTNRASVWKDALWPNHVHVDKVDIGVEMMSDEKDNTHTTGYWEAKNKIDRITNFLIEFLKERKRKVESTKLSFGRVFSSDDRLKKYVTAAEQIEHFVNALKELSKETGVEEYASGSPELHQGFHQNILQLEQYISHAKKL